MHRWLLAACLIGSVFLASASVRAENSKPFVDVSACIARGHFKRATCLDAFDDAWEVYRERTPQFRTREQCNAQFKVCVVFNPPVIAGRVSPRLTPANVRYAPPLLGVVLSEDGFAVQVLIDTTRKPLGAGVPARRTSQQQSVRRSFSGNNFAPPTGSFTSSRPLPGATSQGVTDEIISSPLPVDAPGETSLDGVSTFPVPENRRRKR